MRTIRYYVISKKNNKAVYTNCSERACEEYLNSLPDAKNYYIGYNWLSI